jgi:hypothetical protein
MSLATKPVPVMVTTLPTGPEVGENPVMVSPPAARTDGPSKLMAMAITTATAVAVKRNFMPRLLCPLAAESRRGAEATRPDLGCLKVG